MSQVTHVIIDIQDVTLAILKSNPPQLSIVAVGLTLAEEPVSAALNPYEYFIPPSDGIYDFIFVATRENSPARDARNVVYPIVASHVMTHIPPHLKGVRIHGSTSSRESLLSAPEKAREIVLALNGSVGVAVEGPISSGGGGVKPVR